MTFPNTPPKAAKGYYVVTFCLCSSLSVGAVEVLCDYQQEITNTFLLLGCSLTRSSGKIDVITVLGTSSL
jgi:hypothetical protein